MTTTDNTSRTNSQGFDLVAFGAHPDDVEIFCGGLLAKSSSLGYRVAVVDLTRGELSSRGNLTTRAKETEQANSALGLTHRENLDLPDGSIDASGFLPLENQTQLEVVVMSIRRLKPSIVLIPHRYARHPDHVATSSLVFKAIFFASLTNYLPNQMLQRHQVKQTLFYQMRYDFRPSFIVDISDHYDQKLQAIDAYQSQFGSSQPQTHTEESVQPPTLLSSQLSRQSIISRDEYLGAQIGVARAEGFATENHLSIGDPVQFFTQHPNDKALYFPGTPL